MSFNFSMLILVQNQDCREQIFTEKVSFEEGKEVLFVV